MKICLVNSFYYPDVVGGAEISIKKLAEALVKDGKEVHVICTGKENIEETIKGVIVHRIRINNFYQPIHNLDNNNNKVKLVSLANNILEKYNILNYMLLVKLIKSIKPDIIHTNNLYGISSIVWTVSRKLNIPTIHTLRDYHMLYNKKKNYLLNRFYVNLTQNINCVTAPSMFILNRFCNENYFNASQKYSIFNAVDIDYEESRNVFIQKDSEINNKSKIKFIYFGRLEEYKGILILLDAFKSIKNKNIELIIAGEGSLDIEVSRIVRTDERITYIGFLDEKELNNKLKEIDIAIIPSIWDEPFGRVVIESYKYSIPVIGTNVGGIPEIIEDGITGLLVNPSDRENLKEAIIYFSKTENIKKFIKNCYLKSLKYTVDEQVKIFSDIYNKLNK